MTEKRRHPRIATHEETIYFSILNFPPKTERIHYVGTITNISESGVGAKVLFEHTPGEEVYFEGLNGDRTPRQGVVKWMRASAQSEWYEIGVEFTEQSTIHPAR